MRYFNNQKSLAMIALLLFHGQASSVLAVDCGSRKIHDSTTYQDRGDRCEGKIPKPASTSLEVELISALVDYREIAQPVPDNFKLRFYLPQPTKIHLKVREKA